MWVFWAFRRYSQSALPTIRQFLGESERRNGVNMVNWLKAIGENFTADYLLVALFSSGDLILVSIVLNSYGFVQPEDVRELVIDYISHLKIDIFGDI